MKKIVVALGGNAILAKDPSEVAQRAYISQISAQLVNLVKGGHQVTLIHGNGPQVGNLLLQQQTGATRQNPALSLASCVAMTQGSLGFWLENGLRNELAEQGLTNSVVSLVTQVEVDPTDEAFKQPSKPIGPFFTAAEMKEQAALTHDDYLEDAGRGWRQVVPSPAPKDVLNHQAISLLAEAGTITIAGGGGGIPVIQENGRYESVAAVIDKDKTAVKLAQLIQADTVIFLTGVPNVFVNFNQANEQKLTKVSLSQMKGYVMENQFAPGSMLPKVEAALEFIKHGSQKESIITDEANLAAALLGQAGTIIRK